MEPDLTRALTLGSIALEMRPRPDAIVAAVVFEASERWPYGVMPVKRTTEIVGAYEDDDVDSVEIGVMGRGDGPVVLTGGRLLVYGSFEEMAEDGWRPD